MKSVKIVAAVAAIAFAAMFANASMQNPGAANTPAPSTNLVQPNPNQGKVWNRTKMKIGGFDHEIITMENVPGVICTVAQQTGFGGEALNASVSCVKR